MLTTLGINNGFCSAIYMIELHFQNGFKLAFLLMPA